MQDVQQRSARLILRLAEASKLDQAALKRLGARAVVTSAGGRVDLLLDEATAGSVAGQLAAA